MFDNFTQIPHTVNEASVMMEPMNEITTKFQELVPNNSYNVRWYGNYILISIANLLAVMNGLTADVNNPATTSYYENDIYNFSAEFGKTEGYGLIVHEGPSTKFTPSDYPSAEYLESAEEFLKQTNHHFLKIFTVHDSNYLYVWTNKNLEPDTYYKLYALQVSMFNKENKLLEEFLTHLIANDITKARKTLTDYFTSDEIINREFERFKQCLRNQSQRQMDKIERDINSFRNDIHSYENEIATLASKMRELNEKLAFFKYMQEDNEDHKLFFKHLKKIPYIKAFKGTPNGYLHLEYEAPLIYFSDYPAEKLLAQPQRSQFSKAVVKMIIGRKYELITKCALEFNTGNFSISSDEIRNTDPVVKHPHISRYGCFGNHRQAIYECAETGDYIGAIEQITQAVLNINFYDICVIDTLSRTLEEKKDSLKTWKCVSTGEMLSTTEVIERGDYYEKA